MGKTAAWKTADGIMTVVVTKNFSAFKQLINSHPQMTFIGWR